MIDRTLNRRLDIARQWAVKNRPQSAIARDLGVGPSRINAVILDFVWDHRPELFGIAHWTGKPHRVMGLSATGDARRALVRDIVLTLDALWVP